MTIEEARELVFSVTAKWKLVKCRGEIRSRVLQAQRNVDAIANESMSVENLYQRLRSFSMNLLTRKGNTPGTLINQRLPPLSRTSSLA
jgi:hypothetical protein